MSTIKEDYKVATKVKQTISHSKMIIGCWSWGRESDGKKITDMEKNNEHIPIKSIVLYISCLTCFGLSTLEVS
jgi:hypothetical protein